MQLQQVLCTYQLFPGPRHCHRHHQHATRNTFKINIKLAFKCFSNLFAMMMTKYSWVMQTMNEKRVQINCRYINFSVLSFFWTGHSGCWRLRLSKTMRTPTMSKKATPPKKWMTNLCTASLIVLSRHFSFKELLNWMHWWYNQVISLFLWVKQTGVVFFLPTTIKNHVPW